MSGSRSRVDRERAPQSIPRGRDPSPCALNLRSVSPEPTTLSGIARGHALFDTPPPGEPPVDLGPRNRRTPEKYEYYANERSRSRSHSVASRRTRARKARAASFSTVHSNGPDNDNNSDEGDSGAASTTHDALPAPQHRPDQAEIDPNPDPEPLQPRQHNKNKKARVANPSHPRGRPASRGRGGRARIAREHDRSPSPATSDIAPEEEPTAIYFGSTPPGESQLTPLYETVDHSEFLKYAKAKFGSPDIKDLQNRGTQNLVEMLRIAEEDSQAKVGSSRSKAKIVLFPQSVGTMKGGGWHHRRVHQTQSSDGPVLQSSSCQSLGDSGNSGRGTKRSRPANDTATESETDDDDHAPRPSAAHVAPAQVDVAARSHPPPSSSQHLPVRGTHAPPPSRTGTPTTILESPLHLAQLYDDDVDIPLIPDLWLPVRDTVHARLRARVLERAVNKLELGMRRKAEQAEAARAGADDLSGSETGEGWDMMEEDVDELATSNPAQSTSPLLDNTRAGVYPKTPGPPKRTYAHARTHRAPSTAANYLAEATAPLPRPNSPTVDPAVLFSVERARSVLGRPNIEHQSCAAIRRTVPRTSAATTQAQAGSAPSQHFLSRRQHTNRRLDPVSAARADMVAFNEEVACGNAASFVESATRANRRENDEGMIARCGPMRNRSANGLLDDDEEELAQVQAFAEGRFPKSAGTRRRRNRKKKPLARDSTGLARQILVVAKVHLFAYALMEGIYQTRATFLRWAELIHEKTWGLLIQELPYVAATSDELEVLVNYLATLRGKVKERLRPVIAEIHGLQHRVATQQDVQDNLDAFHQAHPNSFHCASMSPRSGHYESPHLGRVIGAGLGHGPTSVIVQFPEYFENMPITVVAFMLALWQFCLEEWSNGYWQSRELGTAHMLDKYEAHLAGLKELRSVAPRRFKRLQDEWDYTGASFVRTSNGQAVTDRSELRPDSPVERSSAEQWEELDLELEEERMMRDAQMASIETLDDYLETRQLDDRHPTDDVPSHTPSPTPAVEYDSSGRLTARSKGKGRAR
ncbi:hypothetical protein RhiJN_27101 [Ceratobasidium sp. AG-Ba]|nr:hypothetical protein RhiJN_27101 [Ceratobasidium sp. AG-Ba]